VKALDKCLICGAICPEKTSQAARGWDWYHGYLPKTVHFCPRHKGNELRDKLLKIGEKRPEQWTREERNYVEALGSAK
jgi:hypothetical protein